MPYKDREKQRAFQREALARRRLEWLQDNGPCVICGSWKDLEVDHVNPAEKITHRIWSWSKERREAELAKCRVLCEDCHKIRHEAAHGKQRRYDFWKCRCVKCREWKQQHNKRYRKTQGK